MVHFHMPNSISVYLLYITTDCFKLFIFFLIFGKQFDVVHVH